MGILSRRYRVIYRGVFASPFDYDMACCDELVAKLNHLEGKPLTEGQKESIGRLEKLKSLGGIREITRFDLGEFLKAFEVQQALA
jgi:hypothetical protein